LVDLKKIKDLVQLMVDNDLAEISLRDGAEEVNLKRSGVGNPVVASASLPPPAVAALPPAGGLPEPEAPAPSGPQEKSAASVEQEGELLAVRSPMVGTFYSASSPDAPPYVQIGSQVTPDTVVCIVEAMKVFNEIKAEVSGIVERILASNEDPIEYGQELFLVRPA
jgi:acetyl-CoA carboxylase biotin carboxyl carrier protein